MQKENLNFIMILFYFKITFEGRDYANKFQFHYDLILF